MNLIKKICNKKIDRSVHKKFIRFSRGEFNRYLVELRVTSKNLKVKASYDWSNDLFKMIADCIKGSADVKGKIIANYDFSQDLPCEVEKINKSGKKYTALIDTKLNSDSMKQLFEKLKEHYILLNVISEDFKLQCGKSLPKPGKDLKINFCKATLPKELLDEFIFDVDESGKKINIINKFIITDINIPDEFKNNPALARKEAIREGKLIRNIEIDDQNIIKEYQFKI